MRSVSALLFLLVLAGPVWSEQETVAQLVVLGGKKNVFFQSPEEKTEYRAHLEMDAGLNYLFRTDTESLGTLQFRLGGRANIDKGSRIQITGERNILVLENSAVWARFESQPKGEGEIQFRTAGGTLGIRGTEFFLKVDDEGLTTVTLLEGDVDVRPQRGERRSFRARGNEGVVVQYGPRTPLRAAVRAVDERLTELRENGVPVRELRPTVEDLRRGFGRLKATQSRFQRSERVALQGRRRAYYLLTGSDVGAGGGTELDTEGTARRAARLDEKLNQMRAAPETEPDARDILADLNRQLAGSTEETETFASQAECNWDFLEGDRFLFVLLEPDTQNVHWMAITTEHTFRYPLDARPLRPGTYTYRVIPVNDKDEPIGRAVEATIDVT